MGEKGSIPPACRTLIRPRFDGERDDLGVMNADGSDVRRLTETDDAENTPAWSPDGTRIVFTRRPGVVGQFDLVTIRPDGTDERILADEFTLGGFQDPAWSPSGEWILGATDVVDEGLSAIHVMTGEVRTILPESESLGCFDHPSW